jgi:hypothetical protein
MAGKRHRISAVKATHLKKGRKAGYRKGRSKHTTVKM